MAFSQNPLARYTGRGPPRPSFWIRSLSWIRSLPRRALQGFLLLLRYFFFLLGFFFWLLGRAWRVLEAYGWFILLGLVVLRWAWVLLGRALDRRERARHRAEMREPRLVAALDARRAASRIELADRHRDEVARLRRRNDARTLKSGEKRLQKLERLQRIARGGDLEMEENEW